MIQLYERGIVIGAVQNFHFQQGLAEVINIPNFGGFYSVQGRRDPDIVTFQLPFFKYTAGIQELVDEFGNVMEISLVNISSVDNISNVKAYVHSIKQVKQ